VIDGVANETSLLALNAAIIAAQAGEHGRGFSVVAGEIRELATRVSTSTAEITNLIRSVQDESTNAVGAIERGTSSVAKGVELSEQAGRSLIEITRVARSNKKLVEGIVQSVREQTKAATHVVGVIEEVSSQAERIRAAAREQQQGNDLVLEQASAMKDDGQAGAPHGRRAEPRHAPDRRDDRERARRDRQDGELGQRADRGLRARRRRDLGGVQARQGDPRDTGACGSCACAVRRTREGSTS
jgi:hypothetical protein